jgi:hypothetical protein
MFGDGGREARASRQRTRWAGLKLLAAVVWTILSAAFVAGCAGVDHGGRNAPDTAAHPPARAKDSSAERTSPAPNASGEYTRRDDGPSGDKPSGREAHPQPFAIAASRRGGTEGAANLIRDVRFEVPAGYERAVISFGLRGASASRVPVWSLSSPAEEGYVRLHFSGVASTATAGGDFVGLVMQEYYVVRDPNGGLFVDILATDAFQYRVTEFSDPGRLAVDFRLVKGEIDLPVVRGEKTVVIRPRDGETVDSPLEVSGYSRNFEAATTVTLLDAEGRPISSRTIRASDWAEAWGYFETSLDAPAYEGYATLQVGSGSARGGSAWEGVEVPVVFVTR